MRFRKLRIVWSVLCGVLCLLLIALWVRSYKYHDGWDVYRGGGSGKLRVVSWEGVILFASWVFGGGSGPEAGFTHHAILNVQLEANHAKAGRPLPKFRPWKYSKHNYPGGSIERDLPLPHWFLVVVVGSIGAVPWIKNARRFSLRTLLIATTLVAIGLGMVTYLSG